MAKTSSALKTKQKWYDDAQMVCTLLLFWPPVGLYGIYKSGTIPTSWKYFIYCIFLVIGILLLLEILRLR